MSFVLLTVVLAMGMVALVPCFTTCCGAGCDSLASEWVSRG